MNCTDHESQKWRQLFAQGKWEEAFKLYKEQYPEQQSRQFEQWRESTSRMLLGTGWFGDNPPIKNPESEDGLYSLKAARFAYL